MKKKKMGDLLRSLHFTSIICTCWRDKMKSFSFILHKFVMHVTNKQFLDKFDNGCKKIQNGRFTVIFCILLQQFDLVGAITLSSLMAVGYCRVCSCLYMYITNAHGLKLIISNIFPS